MSMGYCIYSSNDHHQLNPGFPAEVNTCRLPRLPDDRRRRQQTKNSFLLNSIELTSSADAYESLKDIDDSSGTELTSYETVN